MASSWETSLWDLTFCIFTACACSHTHTHRYMCSCHVSIVSQQAIECGTSHKNSNIPSFYRVKYYKHFTNTVLYIIFTNKNSSTGKRNVDLIIFLRLLWILLCLSWGLSDYVFNYQQFLCQHRMYFFENKRDLHFVYEDGPFSMY